MDKALISHRPVSPELQRISSLSIFCIVFCLCIGRGLAGNDQIQIGSNLKMNQFEMNWSIGIGKHFLLNIIGKHVQAMFCCATNQPALITHYLKKKIYLYHTQQKFLGN